jgi:hypothetical protein
MLYTLLSSLAGFESAVVLGWSFGLLVVMALFENDLEDIPKEARWTGVAVLFCGFTFSDSLGWGYVDWLTIFYGALFINVFLNNNVPENKPRFVEAGIFAGLALSVKYTAGILALTGIVLVIWLSIKLQSSNPSSPHADNLTPWNNPRFILRNIGMYSLAVISVFLPWMVKNVLATGQPFYPFFVPAGAMSPLRIELYTQQEPWGNFFTRIFLPWYATVQGGEGVTGFGATIGPLFLILIPLAWIGYRGLGGQRKKLLTQLGIIGLSGWIIWAVGSQLSGLLIQTRLYFATFPALIYLSSLGYENAKQLNLRQFHLTTILRGGIVFVLGLNTLQVGYATIDKRVMDYLAGNLSRKEYLEHNLGWYAVAVEYVNNIKPATQVLFLYEPRGFYCLPYCDADEVLDDWFTFSSVKEANHSPVELLERLKAKGYGYLLLNHTGANFVKANDKRYSDRQWNELDELTALLEPLQHFGDSYTFYRIP